MEIHLVLQKCFLYLYLVLCWCFQHAQPPSVSPWASRLAWISSFSIWSRRSRLTSRASWKPSACTQQLSGNFCGWGISLLPKNLFGSFGSLDSSWFQTHPKSQESPRTCQWRARAQAVMVALKLMWFRSRPPSWVPANLFGARITRYCTRTKERGTFFVSLFEKDLLRLIGRLPQNHSVWPSLLSASHPAATKLPAMLQPEPNHTMRGLGCWFGAALKPAFQGCSVPTVHNCPISIAEFSAVFLHRHSHPSPNRSTWGGINRFLRGDLLRNWCHWWRVPQTIKQPCSSPINSSHQFEEKHKNVLPTQAYFAFSCHALIHCLLLKMYMSFKNDPKNSTHHTHPCCLYFASNLQDPKARNPRSPCRRLRRFGSSVPRWWLWGFSFAVKVLPTTDWSWKNCGFREKQLKNWRRSCLLAPTTPTCYIVVIFEGVLLLLTTPPTLTTQTAPFAGLQQVHTIPAEVSIGQRLRRGLQEGEGKYSLQTRPSYRWTQWTYGGDSTQWALQQVSPNNA